MSTAATPTADCWNRLRVSCGPRRGGINEPRASLTGASHRRPGSPFVHGVRHIVGRGGFHRVGLANPSWNG